MLLSFLSNYKLFYVHARAVIIVICSVRMSD